MTGKAGRDAKEEGGYWVGSGEHISWAFKLLSHHEGTP